MCLCVHVSTKSLQLPFLKILHIKSISSFSLYKISMSMQILFYFKSWTAGHNKAPTSLKVPFQYTVAIFNIFLSCIMEPGWFQSLWCHKILLRHACLECRLKMGIEELFSFCSSKADLVQVPTYSRIWYAATEKHNKNKIMGEGKVWHILGIKTLTTVSVGCIGYCDASVDSWKIGHSDV